MANFQKSVQVFKKCFFDRWFEVISVVLNVYFRPEVENAVKIKKLLNLKKARNSLGRALINSAIENELEQSIH